jgi:hypothetical protein
LKLIRQRLDDLETRAELFLTDPATDGEEARWLITDAQASALHHRFWEEVRSWQRVHGPGPCLDESPAVRAALAALHQRIDELSSTGATAHNQPTGEQPS